MCYNQLKLMLDSNIITQNNKSFTIKDYEGLKIFLLINSWNLFHRFYNDDADRWPQFAEFPSQITSVLHKFSQWPVSNTWLEVSVWRHQIVGQWYYYVASPLLYVDQCIYSIIDRQRQHRYKILQENYANFRKISLLLWTSSNL